MISVFLSLRVMSVHTDILTDEIYLYFLICVWKKKSTTSLPAKKLTFLLKMGFPGFTCDSFALKFFQFLSCYFIFLMPIWKFSRIAGFFLSLPSLFFLSNMHFLSFLFTWQVFHVVIILFSNIFFFINQCKNAFQ